MTATMIISRTIRLQTNLLFLLVGITFLFAFVQNGNALPKSKFFTFGSKSYDQVLPHTDDSSSDEIRLRAPIVFYGKRYSSIFVNNNGHVTFETELPNYQSTLTIPSGFKMIAPFLADIDTRGNGFVYYRETQDRDLLSKMQTLIKAHFPETRFRTRSLFIVTWDDVGYFNQRYDKLNTFQLVIASDGAHSYALFNYADNLQWIKSEGKGVHPDNPAQMGFDSGNKYHYERLPYSGSEKAAYVASNSNIDVKGQYLYYISGEKIEVPGDKIEDIDSSGDVLSVIPELEATLRTAFCDSGHECHHNARCIDFTTGYCCQCGPNSYGNGITCLEKGQAQQLHGRMSLTLNKTKTFKLSRYSYIITNSGRAYTSISSIGPEIGHSVILLDGINSFLGFLFGSLATNTTKNGFMITGGKLYHTATVTFDTGEKIYISERFFSHDTNTNMRAETNITGTLPYIRNGSRIKIDRYHEDYVHTGPGVIQSEKTRVFRIDDVGRHYTWKHEIHFDECAHDPSLHRGQIVRHRTMRISNTYNFGRETISFILASSILLLNGSDNCQNAVCGNNAMCVTSSDGGRYQCRCKAGYHMVNFLCEDIDECALNKCGENQHCYNTEGSFICRCKNGFEADGDRCVRRDCYECDPNAKCVYNYHTRTPSCECNSGYKGDGTYCELIELSCNEVNNCGENARCVHYPMENVYRCESEEVSSGDGMTCSDTERELRCGDCDSNAHCYFDPRRFVCHCRCNIGFTGDGRTCTHSVIAACENCSPNADCHFEQTTQSYSCRCKHGFSGDGSECYPRACLDCGENAQCQQIQANQYACVCNPGYAGDGKHCQLATSCRVEHNCDANADCVEDPQRPGNYMCKCRSDYEGNGLQCSQKEITCNLQNNCHHYAECIYDNLEERHRCVCRRGYTGDGITCQRESIDYSCKENPNLCYPNAECHHNGDQYVCVCSEGYQRNGSVCTAVSPDHSFLVFIRGKSIIKMPYINSALKGSRIAKIEDQTPIALAFDCHDQKIYYSDIQSYTIRRKNIDGTVESIIVNDVKSEGIAIDWISRNMYWTDSRKLRIGVSKLDGSDRKTLFDTEIDNPRGIVVDPIRGVLYWTDWKSNRPRIEKSSMDGSDRKIFIHEDLEQPNALTLDYHTQQLCWGDKKLSTIECIHFSGVGRRVLYHLEGSELGIFDMVFYGNSIYWTDWFKNSTISNIKLNSNTAIKPLSTPYGGKGKMYGIIAVTDSCPQYLNACAKNNGKCRFLCLPTVGAGRTCSCPDSVDKKHCSSAALLGM